MKKVFATFALLTVMSTGMLKATEPKEGALQSSFGLSAMEWKKLDGSKKSTSFSLNNFIWEPAVGYVSQKYYPIGFSFLGDFLSFGFAREEQRIDISNTEYRVPTWSIHSHWRLYYRPTRALLIAPQIGLGLNIAKKYTLNDQGSGYIENKTPYFALQPGLLVSLYMVYAKVGYEFVPKFKQINGVVWSVGISIPLKPEWANWRYNMFH